MGAGATKGFEGAKHAAQRDLSELTVDEVANYVAALDPGATTLPSSQDQSDTAAADTMSVGADATYRRVSEALRSGRVDGEQLAMHRFYDVDGLEGYLKAYVDDASALSRLAGDIEEAFYRRTRGDEEKSAAKLRAMIAGTSAMTRCAGLERIEDELRGDDEAQSSRRARVREEATKALAKFELLSPEERASPRYQGALELYSDENLAKREALRTEPRVARWLEKWWLAATAFFGRDAVLTAADYRAFHRRLATVLEKGTETSFHDYDDVVNSDLQLDVADKALVDQEGFAASVFQLVDQWTQTVTCDEYLSFLERGYDAVFGELEDRDKPALPDDLEALHLELLGADGYARETDLDTDRVGDWLEAPDLLDPTQYEIYDATSAVGPAPDEIQSDVDFYETIDEEEAPARRRSVDVPRRRRSSKAVADRRHSFQVKSSTKKSDESRPAAPVAVSEDTPPKRLLGIADIAADVKGKVVVVSRDPRPHVLAKQIEKLETVGAAAVLVVETSKPPQLPPSRRPKPRRVGIPVFVVSPQDAAAAVALGRIRAKKVRLAQFKRIISPMAPQACVEVIAEIYAAKLQDDDRALKTRPDAQRVPLRGFVRQFFRNKYGNSKLFQRKYRSFLFGVLAELDSKTASDEDDAHALVTLFAQLCGIGTKSGRVLPFEASTTHFVLDHLRLFEPILADTSKLVPTSARTPIQKRLTNAKAARLVGVMFKTKARATIHRALTMYLRLSKRDEVYKVAMAALRALATTVPLANDRNLEVIPCPATLALLAVTYAACDCPHVGAVQAPLLGPKASTDARDPQPAIRVQATPFR